MMVARCITPGCDWSHEENASVSGLYDVFTEGREHAFKNNHDIQIANEEKS